MFCARTVLATSLALLLSLGFVPFAFGATIQYTTSPGDNIGGETVHALGTFTTSANNISVILQNLQADPTSPKSIIYDVFFTVSTGQNSGSISSTTGIERTVNSGGTYSDTGTVNVIDWTLATSGAQLHLDRLSAGGQPAHGVIGPPNSGSGKYDAANGSIAGNGPHNPFWAGTADFELNVPGVTAASTITAVAFSFNTTAGNNITAVVVPEPSAAVLAGMAGLLMASVYIFRRHAIGRLKVVPLTLAPRSRHGKGLRTLGRRG
jgi:hypothetical protein